MTSYGERGEPIWSDDELERDRKLAIERFIADRLAEGSQPYTSIFPSLEASVRQLFDNTHSLRDIDRDVFVANPILIHALRHVGGPPVSEDDLETLAQGGTMRKRLSADAIDRAIGVLMHVIDPFRCPWLHEDRPPTPTEREAAIIATTCIWCAQRVGTKRRMESSAGQQEEVMNLLDRIGWNRASVSSIRNLDDLPRGQYAPETLLHRDKADVPVRLRNGLLLAIECKVSNSYLNSVKRINDVLNKAAAWQAEYGRQVITVAVLAGVFKSAHLRRAQAQNVVLFFDHRLDEFATFVQRSS